MVGRRAITPTNSARLALPINVEFNQPRKSNKEAVMTTANIGEFYESLGGGLRHRKPGESYKVGVTFRLLRSITHYGQWEGHP